MRHYYRQLMARIILLFIVLQALIAAGLWLWYNQLAETITTSNPIALTIGLFLLLELAASILLAKLAAYPIKEVSDAITYAYHDSVAAQKAHHDLISLTQAIRRLNVRKEPDHKVSAEHGFSQALLDNLPIGIIVLDADRKIIYHNKVAPMHGGGKQLNIAFKDVDSLDVWLDGVNEKSVSADHWWRRMRLEHLDNQDDRQFFDIFASHHQEGVDSIETILVIIDRTAQYSTDEDDLDFTALAAHELRGPITVIKGYLDVLRHELEPRLNDDQRAFFERLDVSADRLTTYINNILNVSRYDRQHLQLHLKEESLATIYKTIADDLDLRARTQHRMLNVDFSEDLPTVAADRSSLCEVIINLVDNAIKYSNEGGLIIVKGVVKGKFVEVTVQDSGVGIPASLIGNLFEKFYRSHRSRETTVGTGLGLYISRAIIESHGGTIGVRSDEGHGSIFSFTVPIYATIANKLGDDSGNQELLASKKKYIKNHSVYRR